MIKQRKAKRSQRGIFIQDKELLNTVFQPGTHFKYVIDVKQKKVVILPSDKGNTVSKRKYEEKQKPVIDIRKKEVLSAFQDCEYLQVSIYKDEIRVEGFEQEEQYSCSQKKNKEVKTLNKVVSIEQILKVRKKIDIVCSKKQLQEVSNGIPGQIDIFDFIDDIAVQNASVFSLESFKQLDIPLQIVSLFSGSGVFDFGFQNEGFDIVFAIEKDEDAVKTYRQNLGGHITCHDITTYPKENIPNAPIIIGGPPCQGFSNANRKTNFLDNPNNKLLKNFIDIVKNTKNCQLFILENVPQLLTVGNGAFKNEILKQLSDFDISYGVLNSAHFGNAQIRNRSIFIGSKIGHIDLPVPTYEENWFKTVRQAFKGLHDNIPNQKDFSKPKLETIERMKHVPEGGNIFDIPKEIRPKGVHSNMYKRLAWDEPSITIANPRKAVITHPFKDRILSIRECARLLGLPDSFTFKGKLASMQQQVANAVPVELGKAIARRVKQAIYSFRSKHALV
ncbi:DNA cytosine methyltransferase [Bacillus cereus]|uniref:DNA (cytosine-5-)-methyltransferase n=1 Tax=Bacillus cereus (strain VD146) TaxID=1053236 RepID=R8MDU8_BACCX|nr:DNA cytosine methyltransferase [Bacillus cereus]EOP32287.1 DNA (cytosine-5-)-methyltransferase [Bacillus cereus VD146]